MCNSKGKLVTDRDFNSVCSMSSLLLTSSSNLSKQGVATESMIPAGYCIILPGGVCFG